jgi:hypothetical protein
LSRLINGSREQSLGLRSPIRAAVSYITWDFI